MGSGCGKVRKVKGWWITMLPPSLHNAPLKPGSQVNQLLEDS